MRVLAGVCLAVAGSAVWGEDMPAWAGYWAEDPSWCAAAGSVGDDAPEYIAPDGIFGLEYSCDFVSIAPIGVGQSWRMDLACLDAGETFNLSEIFAITSQDRLVRISDDGWMVTQHRCAKSVQE